MRRGSPALSVGRLTQVQTGGATTRSITQYDALGRILADSQTADGNTYPFSYAYNLLGKLTSMTYPSLRVVKTWYDPAGRSCVVGGTTCTATNGFAGSTSYAENGALEQVTLGNGLVETTTFNNRFQPTALTAATGSQLLNLTFGYPASGSNNGNVVSENVVTAGGLNAQQVFTYDAFNRLLVASENPANATSPVCPDAASAWCQSFGYDQFGNRAVTAYGPQTGTFLNPNWTPSSATQFNGGNQWTRGLGDAYDAAGNLLSLASNSSPGTAASVFSYDGENRMTASNVMNTGGVQYVYDGSGQRVEKIAGGTKTVYVYDAQGQLAAEYSTAVNTARATEYLTTDPLGSTRLVTSATGGVVKRYDYVPFGEEVSVGIGGRAAGDGYGSGTYPNTPDVVSEKFTGKERDSESGLDYFGARYYGSALGRFTSPDKPLQDQSPDNPQTWNLYVYGRNNPLNGTDPDGENWFTDFLQAVTNCFRYDSCHTTAVVAQRIEKKYLSDLRANGRPLTAAEQEDLQAQLFGGSSNHQAIRKTQDLFNNTPKEDDPLRWQAATQPLGGPIEGPAPRLTSNPKHNPNSASPEPSNVQELFDKSVEDSTGVRWAKDSDGAIHRFSRPNNGETHWNGSTAGAKPIRLEDIPIQVRRALQ